MKPYAHSVEGQAHIRLVVVAALLYRLDGNVNNRDRDVQDKPKRGAREKVLQAAEELAVELGPTNFSLEAVATRAGVSKGGLLYHFPSKARLLEALVESYVERFECELSARVDEAQNSTGIASAYLDLFIQEHRTMQPPPAGLLAAMVENPDFLRPVRRHQRDLLNRIKESAPDPLTGMVVFLTLHGIRSQELLSMQTIDDAEFDAIMARLREMLVR